jgi:hypothetical protein
MSLRTDRLPISGVNVVLVTAFVVGGLVTLVLGHVLQAVGLFLVGAGGLHCALWARRPSARDVTRLNALEWRDERDRQLGKEALSVVGATALVLSIVELVVVSVLAIDAALWLAWIQLVVLMTVWALMNSIVVRRG